MSSARLRDGRRHAFFIMDNEFVDECIERIPEKRRADALAAYVVLARHADTHGVAWPGVEYIGAKMGRSKPVVIEAISELGKAGLIGKERRGQNKTNVYVLEPIDKAGGKQDLPPEVNRIDTKNTQKEEDYEANASRQGPSASPEAQTIIPVDKYTTDRMYNAYKLAGFPRWTKEEYGYHLGRVQLMLKENAPTDEELHELPAAFIRYYTNWNPKADAILTLREMRRQKVRHLHPVTDEKPSRPGGGLPSLRDRIG